MISQSPVIYSVTQLNKYVKGLLENDGNLENLFVTGEISNFKAHYSGHYYMTIKDDKASVKAVMFKTQASRLRFRPEDGMKVLVFGTVSLFERDGAYQLYISDMQPDGLGALNAEYEQLKEKLYAEGLFDKSKKKPLPLYPERVGVITAKTGAAVHDIIDVLGRRFPAAQIVFCPVPVQGEGAAAKIADAIRLMNERCAADVIIVGRGGGSLEDLWAFNEEITARAVAASKIPVISAVGHETDVTICDYAADLRAPTPSAAAELAVPDAGELKRQLFSYSAAISSYIRQSISTEKERLNAFKGVPGFKNPAAVVREQTEILANLGTKLLHGVSKAILTEKSRFSTLSGKLDALSPLRVVERGYGIISDENGIVTAAGGVKIADSLSIKFFDGTVRTTVTGVDKNGTDI